MFECEPFDATLERLRSGDEGAAEEVFRHFLRRLIVLAGKQFDARLRERADVEDAVLSAFRTFFSRAGRGEFDLTGWGQLWSLLAVITLRKCARRQRALKAARRDPSREAEARGVEGLALWQVPDPSPSPVEVAIVSETIEELLQEARRRRPADRRAHPPGLYGRGDRRPPRLLGTDRPASPTAGQAMPGAAARSRLRDRGRIPSILRLSFIRTVLWNHRSDPFPSRERAGPEGSSPRRKEGPP